MDHRPARQQGGPRAGVPDQGGRPAGGLQCHRPRDPGARRGRASATTSRWPGSTAGTGRCGCSTAPTRCTCAPSPAPSSAARSPLFAAAVTQLVAVDVGELSGAWNFRDVAEETGVRPGRFFRSSELSRLSTTRAARSSPAGHHRCRRPAIGPRSGAPRAGSGTRGRGGAPAAVPRGVRRRGEAPHEAAFQKMMSEKPDDEDVAVAAHRFMTEEYLIPDPRRCATRCAASHFAARRRAAGDRPLLRGQGPHRLHRGDGARCHRCRPRRDHGRFLRRN